MAYEIRRIDYFYTAIKDRPGEAHKLLSQLADLGVNQLAFAATPIGPGHVQLTLFPEDKLKLISEGEKARLELDGPYPAILVQGDDQLGTLTDIHVKIYEAGINVYASTGVTDGRGGFGYVLYVHPEDYEKVTSVLDI